jgi:hypothetical protein
MLELPLFGVVTGIEIPADDITLLGGVALKRQFADIFSTPLMAYVAPEPGMHHPAPWTAVEGGTFLRCRVEIQITTADSLGGLSPTILAWLIAALLRLHLDAPIRLAAVRNMSFTKDNANEPSGKLFEAAPVQWGVFHPGQDFVLATDSNLAWLRRQLPRAIALWHEERFQRSFTIFDQSRWSATADACAVMLWTAIEILLETSALQDKGKLISQRLAALVAADAADKERAQQVIRALYRNRGSIVHAGGTMERRDFIQLFRLATVAFQNAVVLGLPTQAESTQPLAIASVVEAPR